MIVATAFLGHRHDLRALERTAHGLILDGGSHGRILLPNRYVQPGDAPGSVLNVFVYRDSEDRLVATTEKPLAQVGEFAALRVVGGDERIGAFLDWGLPKDLLLPNRELSHAVRIGDIVVVYIHIDKKSDRIVATTKLDGLLGLTPPAFKAGQRVKVLIAGETPLGFKAIVENSNWGMIFRAESGIHIPPGTAMNAYVRAVRPDGKIDLGITPSGYGKVTPLTDLILDALEAAGGHLAMSDRSSPSEIQSRFATSKKAFKAALGALYKRRKIVFTDDGIALARRKA